jgi:hypothetical protein
MTPKKIWGVIIIILGIFLFFNGASKCYEAEFYGNEIQSMGRLLSKSGSDKFFNTNRYQKLIEQEKTNGVIGALIGIAMAVGETLLLREKKKGFSRNFKDGFDKKDGKWGF